MTYELGQPMTVQGSFQQAKPAYSNKSGLSESVGWLVEEIGPKAAFGLRITVELSMIAKPR
jgi:hypothetical protein